MIYHADIKHFLPGGFLGVDVFFVISGFLITHLLLLKLESAGTIHFADFMTRRIKRLLPALLCVLAVCALYTIGFARDALKALQSDLLPALLYYSNFWQLLDSQSYFEHFGRPHALQHLWSLAIEMQFYLLWPLLVVLFFRCRRLLPLPLIIGMLAAASAGWMAWLAVVHNIPYENPPERLYFGTDTHTMGLLAGALLASVCRPDDELRSGVHWGFHMLGGAMLAYLLACFWWFDESSALLYLGGFASVSLATLFLMQSTIRHGSLTNILFRNRLLDWLGKRSYSLYLWHWPVFVYFRPGEELPDDLFIATAIRLCLTLVLAHFTYQCVETPIRSKGLQAFGRAGWLLFPAACVTVLCSFAAVLIGPLLGLTVPAVSAQAALPAQVIRMPISVPVAMPQAVMPAAPAMPSSAPAAALPADAVALSSKLLAPGADGAQSGVHISALGDSVMLGAQQVMTQRLPISYIDAKVGRQGSDLLKLVKTLADSKLVSDTVLIHIGTNGYIYEQNLKQLLQLLQDKKQLVFVNVHADRRWTDDNNALLKKYQALYKNMTLVDWNAASANHPEYFVKDGIHLTGKGMAAYSELIRLSLGVPDMRNPVPVPVLVARPVSSPVVMTPHVAMKKPASSPVDDATAGNTGSVSNGSATTGASSSETAERVEPAVAPQVAEAAATKKSSD